MPTIQIPAAAAHTATVTLIRAALNRPWIYEILSGPDAIDNPALHVSSLPRLGFSFLPRSQSPQVHSRLGALLGACETHTIGYP